jgi:hypothetical protein
MKLLRHLLAVSTMVALVVALGFAWKGSGAASLVADGRGEGRPPSATVGKFGAPHDGGFDQRGGGGFSPSNIGDLEQTLMIEALIVAGVVAIDVARRRRRRAQAPTKFPGMSA